MKQQVINQIFFSPTGNCKKVSGLIAEALGGHIKAIDITSPKAREKDIMVPNDEVLVMVMPVYASRLPNKIMPFVRDMIKSHGARAVIAVTYGNRDFGDALMELKNILEENGFKVVAAAALACQHSFAPNVGKGRPNAKDVEEIRAFANRSSQLLEEKIEESVEIEIKGNNPVGPYYQPKGIDGEPTIFLKAKAKTDEVLCKRCGQCAMKCPLGSINQEDPTQVLGICIKCHSCVNTCPAGAKYFDDTAFLSHKAMLEQNYVKPNDNYFFYLK